MLNSLALLQAEWMGMHVQMFEITSGRTPLEELNDPADLAWRFFRMSCS